ncbi:hypothetical protein R1sor_015542 [Riccia sorocarpa]|uniref:Uncharacterized protein n=1 Tax=Riccia sorocarpa TaxID=122646 RepID=A0ABD3HCV8_9MARC
MEFSGSEERPHQIILGLSAAAGLSCTLFDFLFKFGPLCIKSRNIVQRSIVSRLLHKLLLLMQASQLFSAANEDNDNSHQLYFQTTIERLT